jgi:hypothetical protein
MSGRNPGVLKQAYSRAVLRLKDENAVALIACLVFSFVLYNYVNLRSPVRVPFSPDENGILSTVKLLTDNGSIFWTSPLNQR